MPTLFLCIYLLGEQAMHGDGGGGSVRAQQSFGVLPG